MTKRGQKTPSAIIHGSSRVSEQALYMALIEQLFEAIGPVEIASFIAERLRDPSPTRAVLEMVARLLDPQSDYCFKLAVVRLRRGKNWTKEVNDAAIAEEYEQALGGKHGGLKKAVGEIANRFAVSEAKVRKAKRGPKMIR